MVLREDVSAAAPSGTPPGCDLDDWIARLAMRGVSPSLIAAQDGSVLAASRTDDDISNKDQLTSLINSIKNAAPGDVISLGGFE